MTTRLVLALLLSLLALPAGAAMVTRNIDYTVGDVPMRSVLVWDDAVATPRPGLVLAPDWYGVNDDQIKLAGEIAGRDYVVLVADVYGTATRPATPEAAGAAVRPLYADRGELRARMRAALKALLAQADAAPLDTARIGAIGFCFGGAAALDLARSGAEIAGVATFHGSLSTDDPALAKDIRARVLVMNGADDKAVPAAEIHAFEAEMRAADVDWQFINYGGAVHCFAIPGADGSMPGCKYDARTARRALAQMHAFFADAFAGR